MKLERKWEQNEKEGKLPQTFIGEGLERRTILEGEISISISILDVVSLRCQLVI